MQTLFISISVIGVNWYIGWFTSKVISFSYVKHRCLSQTSGLLVEISDSNLWWLGVKKDCRIDPLWTKHDGTRQPVFKVFCCWRWTNRLRLPSPEPRCYSVKPQKHFMNARTVFFFFLQKMTSNLCALQPLKPRNTDTYATGSPIYSFVFV